MIFVNSVNSYTCCRESCDFLKALLRRETFGLVIAADHFAPGFFEKWRPQLFFFYYTILQIVIGCGGNNIIDDYIVLLAIAEEPESIQLFIEVDFVIQ